MPQCAVPDANGFLQLTADPVASCTGVVVLDVLEYEASLPWAAVATFFDVTQPGYWAVLSACLGLITASYVIREVGRQIKYR